MLGSALTYYQSLIEDSELESNTRAELTETFEEVAAIHEELTLRRDDRAFALLERKSVQEDLALTPEQYRSLFDDAAFQQMNPQTQPLAMARQRRLLIARTLLPEQTQRLQQIALQLQGPSAILESIFTGSLNLSNAQATEIQKTFIDYLIANADSRPNEIQPSGLSPSSFRPDEWLDAEMRQELLQLVLERLTPEQAEAWSEIVGREFSGGEN